MKSFLVEPKLIYLDMTRAFRALDNFEFYDIISIEYLYVFDDRRRVTLTESGAEYLEGFYVDFDIEIKEKDPPWIDYHQEACDWVNSEMQYHEEIMPLKIRYFEDSKEWNIRSMGEIYDLNDSNLNLRLANYHDFMFCLAENTKGCHE